MTASNIYYSNNKAIKKNISISSFKLEFPFLSNSIIEVENHPDYYIQHCDLSSKLVLDFKNDKMSDDDVIVNNLSVTNLVYDKIIKKIELLNK